MTLPATPKILSWMAVLMLAGMVAACATSRPAPPAQVLAAPATTAEKAAPYMAEGTRYFLARDWSRASQAFQQAVVAQPELAEAQYNLAVSLDHEGKTAEAKKHYFQAASLAPGNKIIWSAPPLLDAVKAKPILKNPPIQKNYPAVAF
ncbi:MAG: hypothetical protein ITD36_04525 [Nitrospira sp.]|nr:hypothetical protein [Nitrospira sp.]MBP0122422.1 hypothetical protein [Nitrospira sp.]MBP0127576.1 hypothetical protein [Nitrospira sp.]MBP0130875.1 hypothetical protein [Nitrospira sp.]